MYFQYTIRLPGRSRLGRLFQTYKNNITSYKYILYSNIIRIKFFYLCLIGVHRLIDILHAGDFDAQIVIPDL